MRDTKPSDIAEYRLSSLSGSLWKDGFSARSTESTPLYIVRYSGPRETRDDTHHEFWELTTVLSGHGAFCGDSEVSLQAGMLVLVPPGYAHHEKAVEDMDTIWIGCRGTRFDALPRSLVVVHAADLVLESERLWLAAQQGRKRVGPALDAGLTSLVGGMLNRRDTALTTGQDGILADVIAFMHEHVADSLSVAELASRAGWSEGYFSRVFRQHTGQSVIEFAITLRIQRAAHLLRRTNLTASEISGRVGFSDASYFNRMFRQRLGTTPRAFRQQMTHTQTTAVTIEAGTEEQERK